MNDKGFSLREIFRTMGFLIAIAGGMKSDAMPDLSSPPPAYKGARPFERANRQ